MPDSAATAFSLFTEDGHIRPLQEIEDEVIRVAMNRYGGQMSETARRLKIGRSTMYRKIHGLNLKTESS